MAAQDETLDAIDRWHEMAPCGLIIPPMSLRSWLGWSEEQYAAYVMHGYDPGIKTDAPCRSAVYT